MKNCELIYILKLWIKNYIELFQRVLSIRREIEEEAGIEVGKINYLCDMTFIRPDNIPVIVLSFYAPYKSGEIKLDSESANHAWATFEELKNHDLIEGIADEIKMVEEEIKKAA